MNSVIDHIDAGRLRRVLAARVPHDLRVEGFRESAVLVPILIEPDFPPRLILTERQARLRNHAGQIAFPGGKRDDADLDLASTAVRETAEELGIPATRIDVLGLLDCVPTPTGYNITPVVGIVAGPVVIEPSAAEVAQVYLLALSSLRDPIAYRSEGVREFLGVRYEMHEYHLESLRIWGATARIIWQLLSVFDPA